MKIKIYRTIVLSVGCYGYETWSLILREKRRLRMLENRVLRQMLGPKKDEVTGSGENYIMMSLMISIPNQIFFGSSD